MPGGATLSDCCCTTTMPNQAPAVQSMTTHPIVLIDDDPSWAEAAAELLHNAGFEVETAHDGQAGLELLEQSSPLLVILDVHLPRLGGLDVLHELRCQGCCVPVLMISGEDQADLMARALAAGASAFLRKPVNAVLLLRAVRQLVRSNTGH